MGRRHEHTSLQRRHTDGQQTHGKMLNITHHQRNAKSKPQQDITSHLSEWLKSTPQETSVGKDVGEKRNPRALLVGMQTGIATVENSMEFPQKN